MKGHRRKEKGGWQTEIIRLICEGGTVAGAIGVKRLFSAQGNT